jgi:2-succinyl-5-enolpyruvyl-6-hydroxy-3-cyclohexene-1-carboxylate synthase
MLKDILISLPKNEEKLLLIINSPGGDPLAAERIVKVCREFSGHDYWVLVPGRSKSAATMITLGASKIIMTATAELGPIDIQIPWKDKLVPAHVVVSSYEELMEKGINLPKDQRMEPILQQLQEFNAPEIEHLKNARDLSMEIADKVLKEGMLAGVRKKELDHIMHEFIIPKKLKNHGRPIFFSDLKQIDTQERLSIELLSNEDEIYSTVHEYHMRLMCGMSSAGMAKTIETPEDEFSIQVNP